LTLYKYLVKKDSLLHVKTNFSWQNRLEDLKKILCSRIPEYKRFVIFAATVLGLEDLNEEIFTIFSDESEDVKVRIAAMYQLVANSHGEPEQRRQFLTFCENNRQLVEAEARRFYGEESDASDEIMLNKILDELNDHRDPVWHREEPVVCRFLYLYNLSFIKDKDIKKKASDLARKYLENDDNIVREAALKVLKNTY